MQSKKFKIKTKKVANTIIPVASVSFFGLVFAFMFIPNLFVPKDQDANALESIYIDGGNSLDQTPEDNLYTEENSNYSLSVQTSEVNFSIVPTRAGTSQIVSDTVTTTTTAKTGYRLYLSTSADDSKLRRAEDDETKGESNWIYPAIGSFENPSALEIDSKKPAVWGYAVAGLNNFDQSYEGADIDTAKFAAVPSLGNEQLIRSVDHAVTNDETTVYYGLRANLGLAGGTYSAEINYITLIDLSDLAGASDSVADSDLETDLPTSLPEGYSSEEVTITTPIYTSMSDLGKISVKIGDVSCQNIYLSSQSPITLTCTFPAGLPAGTYDLAVEMPKLDKSLVKTSALTIETSGRGSAAEENTIEPTGSEPESKTETTSQSSLGESSSASSASTVVVKTSTTSEEDSGN